MIDEGYDRGKVILTAVGDSMITRKLSVYNEESFLSLIKMLRDADVAYTNLEILLHKGEGFPTKAEWWGTYMFADPSIAQELKWAGFDMVSRANNHAMDYGEGGMIATTEALDKVGIIHCGIGKDIAEAREPVFLETSTARIAFVSVCSYFFPWERASGESCGVKARPGINGLRYTTYCKLDQTSFNELKKIAEVLGIKNQGRKKSTRRMSHLQWPYWTQIPDGEFDFLDNRFVLGDKPGVYREVNELDVKENLKTIEGCRRQADLVVINFHWHEAGSNREEPADFVEQFSRNCIDAGADIVLGTGPHAIRGIEIYKQKPIIYSLGNFIAETETTKRLPADAYEKFGLNNYDPPADYHDRRLGIIPPESSDWWESIMVRLEYDERKLTDLRVYPLTLCENKPKYQRGRPLLAKGIDGKKIIDKVTNLSSKYGTRIELKDGVGVVKLG